MPSNMNDDERQRFSKMEYQIEQLTTDVHSLKKTIEELRDIIVEARGGWHVTMAFGAVASFVAGVGAWIFSNWKQ